MLCSFSKMAFKDKIEQRIKRSTIRPCGKRMVKLGSTLHMWYKSRTPKREFWGTATVQATALIDIYPLAIGEGVYYALGAFNPSILPWKQELSTINWLWNTWPDADLLAGIEGFDSAEDLHAWFRPLAIRDNPYRGRLIYWGTTFTKERP